MSKRLRLIPGIAVSLFFLWLTMRNIKWRELGALFVQVNYLYLLPGLLLVIFTSGARAYRWRLLMYPSDTATGYGGAQPLGRIFHIVNIGYFFNNVFPAKAGELVRAYLAGRMIPGGIGQAISTLLIERLLDVLSLVLITLLLIPVLMSQQVPVPDWAVKGGLLFGGVAVVGAVTLLVLSRLGERGVDWVWRFVGRIPLIGHPRVKAMLQNLLAGFRVLSEARVLPGILLGSAMVWCGYALFNYVLLAAFRMAPLPFSTPPGEQALPFSATVLVLCATGFGMVLPSSPGAVGVFEWAAVQALLVYRVDQSQAFGYALGLHLFTNVVLILLGLLGLFVEGLSYADIRRQVADSAAPPTGGHPPHAADTAGVSSSHQRRNVP